MNLLTTASDGAFRLVLAAFVAAAMGWGARLHAADGSSPGVLRPTEAPALLPVEAGETATPSSIRLFAEEPQNEPRADQSRFRVLCEGAGGAVEERAASRLPETSAASATGAAGHDGAWSSRAEVPSSGAGTTIPETRPRGGGLPVVVGQSAAASPIIVRPTDVGRNDAPPEGPWCFAGDGPVESCVASRLPETSAWSVTGMVGHAEAWPSRAGTSGGVVAAGHEESRPAGRLDTAALLAMLEETPRPIAQNEPEIPRVLPPPHAMLPPDPGYEDLRSPVPASPFRAETRRGAETSPAHRPTAGAGPAAEEVWQRPAMAPRPQAAAPYDFDRELERYSQRESLPSPGGPCAGHCYGGPCRAVCSPCGPRRLLRPSALECRDVTLGGWVDQGITGVGNNPLDRYNGPVTFNDRYADYQMNQLYAFLERPTCTDGGGFDLGGRIDFLYGTDARFVKAADGLEASWGQTHKLYQAAVPQFYVDAAWNDLVLRLGHFYKIMGYEEVPAPCNFFYSHSYAFQYGEPQTHTGMMASCDVEPGLSLAGGFSRGINQFDDTDGRDQLGVLAAIDWASCDGQRSVQFGVTSGEQGPDNITTIYSLVGQLRLTERLSWILEHNYGQSTGGNPRGIRKAEWYGLSQYVLYQWTETLGLGTRIEWFCDEDGTRVRGLGEGNLATGPYPGPFYEITLGANWRPGPNVMLRPEVRWDWYNGVSPVDHRPYDGGQSDRQLLYGVDLVVQF